MAATPRESARVSLLRPTWSVLGDGFYLGLFLAALAVAIRGIGMLGPQRLFWVLPVGFLSMALVPYVFLTKESRKRIGLRPPRRAQWVLWGILLGAIAAVGCYWLGMSLYGVTDENWFVSVRRAFPVKPEMANFTKVQLFWMMTIPSMIFSPLGEEIFFRGFLQAALEQRCTYRKGVIVDAAWFAVVHLFHHGIVRVEGQIELFPLSGTIWVVLIFGAGLLFAALLRKTGSLLAPVLAHAAFNLAMNYTIFYWLAPS